MAPGIEHCKAHNKLWIPSIITGIVESIILQYFFKNYNEWFIVIFILFYLLCYSIAEHYISPDLDLLSISGQDGRALTKIKNNVILGIVGLLFAMWSMVYSWIMQFFGGHRGLSHTFILGTLTRMIWFNTPIFFILWFLKWYWGFEWNKIWYNFYMDWWLFGYVLGQFFSWLFSDVVHSVMDSEYAKNRFYKVEKKHG